MARFVFEDAAPAAASAAPAARFVFEDEPAPAPVGRGESGLRGALQGASLGFGDESAAAIDAALPSFLRNSVSDEAVGTGQTYGERYANARDYYRRRNAAAEASNPGTYLTGQVAGAVLTSRGLPVQGARGVLSAAGQGAAEGVGYSEANEGLGLARDSALGGALGVAGFGAGAALGAAASRAKGAAGRLMGSARRRALGQATKEVDEAVASARGQLGAETQAGNRYAENLRRLEGEFAEGAPDDYLYHVTPRENLDPIAARGLRPDAPKIAEGGPHGDTRAVFLSDADTVPTYRDLYGGDAAVLRVRRSEAGRLKPDEFSEGAAWMTPDAIPANRLEALGPDGKWTPLDPGRAALRRRYAETADARRALEERLAASNLESLPGQAGTIAAKRAALDAVTQAAPQAIAARTGELMQSSVRPDTRSLLKSYAEPVLMSAGLGYLGDQLGGEWGGRMGAAGGFIFGRTRGGKALMNRIKKPGNQNAAARLLERTARRAQLLRRPVATGLPVLAIPGITEDEAP
jgi:hypothetical protein